MVATMIREDWTGYVQRITRGVAAEDVAAAAGVHITTVYRWLRNPKQKSPEQVIKFARGLRQPPGEALIAAGYLEPDELDGVIEVYQSRSELSDDELVAELIDRLAERPPRPKVDDVTHRLARLPDEDIREGFQNG